MKEEAIHLYTIGFTEKSAEEFFGLLHMSGVSKVIDTRVNNASQLAGFAKGRDLAYFCRVLGGLKYEHRLEMAPTRELLSDYRKGGMIWDEYARRYLALLQARNLRANLRRSELDGACLLCSEHLPEHCHRSLLADYIRQSFPETRIEHLVA
jgi:uncharacterized protein (DUF488 family)